MRIELKDVHKRYERTEVLRGVDAVLEPGEQVALVGPNGSGKSTLIRALLGLVACEGRVLLDGREPHADRATLAQRLGYVPQVAPQLSATVDEVVRLVTETRGLPRVAVLEIAARLGLVLGEIARRPFRALSGGMKQKLLIACALAARPELLVLDEPTASLDTRARERFFALMAEVPKTTTVVLCSHRLEELQHLAARVIALEEGRIVHDGPAHARLDGSAQTVVERLLAEREVLDA